MKKCTYESKYDYGLTRCLRDGSLRKCTHHNCPHFKATLLYKIYRWW